MKPWITLTSLRGNGGSLVWAGSIAENDAPARRAVFQLHNKVPWRTGWRYNGAMQRVTGLGGVFFKGDDPEKLYGWYEKHLGIKREPHNQSASFRWRGEANPSEQGETAWSIFPRNSKYFGPSGAQLMINYRVEDLDALLEALRAEGVQIDPHREDCDFGRFAWIFDPEGNKIELWEPPK